ncbi:MAG: ComEC/Rec2 family competence protein [Patescibacteria group bacterium]
MGKVFKNLYFPFRIFTVLSFSFLLGTLFVTFINLDFNRSWPVFLFIIPFFLISAFINFILNNKLIVLWSFALLAFSFSLFYYSYFEAKNKVNLPYDQEIEITGRIEKRPEVDWEKQKLVVLAQINDQTINILVNAPHFPEYHFGETVRIKGKIVEPVNLGDFDYKSYLKRYLIFGLINNPEISFENENHGIYWKTCEYLYNISIAFETTINRLISEPHASLAAGLILGVKRNIPDNLIDQLKITGLTHIIALSGFNVTILIAVFSNYLVGIVGRKRAFWLGLLMVIGFVLMTGGAPSVVRASIFSLLILFGRTVGRQADQTNLMLLAAFVMVIFNPFIVRYDIGFQLSFIAFAGLIYLTPVIEKGIEKWRTRALPQFVKSMLAETLGAQFAVMPILFIQFGTISLISPFANILVVWIVPWAMLAAFIAGLIGIIYFPLGKLVALLLWPFLEYIIKIVEWLAQVPGAAINFK